MNAVVKYWGYLTLILVISLLLGGYAGTQFIVALALVTSLYFLIQAPVWCGAPTRGEQLCRNNASGVLIGCHLRQHKWQKLKWMITPPMWRRLNRGLWSNPATCLATAGLLVSIITSIISTVKAVMS